jgi:hypothetical protein
MSSLPLISHHLFVEAASHEDHSPRKVAETPPVLVKGIATAVPLELLTADEPLPAKASSPRRASSYAGGG